MEGILSGLHNFSDRFRDMSQRFVHLRVARYEFLHNHSHLDWQQTFKTALRSIFSIPRRILATHGASAPSHPFNILLPISAERF